MAEWRYAKLADGTTLRFPANTPDEVVHRTVKSRVSEERANAMFPPQDVPEMSAPMPMMDAQFPAQSPEPRTVADALAPPPGRQISSVPGFTGGERERLLGGISQPPAVPQGSYEGVVNRMSGRKFPGNPGDPIWRENFNTHLPPEEEALFQNWLVEKSKVLGRDVSMDLGDYDIRGGKPWLGDVNDLGHGRDTWKKPNHPTFSDESVYHGKEGFEGGSWGDGTFTAGPSNLDYYGEKFLKKYMAEVEPGVKLIIPEHLKGKPKKSERPAKQELTPGAIAPLDALVKGPRIDPAAIPEWVSDSLKSTILNAPQMVGDKLLEIVSKGPPPGWEPEQPPVEKRLEEIDQELSGEWFGKIPGMEGLRPAQDKRALEEERATLDRMQLLEYKMNGTELERGVYRSIIHVMSADESTRKYLKASGVNVQPTSLGGITTDRYHVLMNELEQIEKPESWYGELAETAPLSALLMVPAVVGGGYAAAAGAPAMMALGVGALFGVLPEALVEAGDVYAALLEQGLSPEEARKKAHGVLADNVALLTITNLMEFGGGALAAKIGVKGVKKLSEKFAKNFATRALTEIAPRIAGVGIGIEAGATVEGWQEWAQEGFAQAAEGVAGVFDNTDRQKEAKRLGKMVGYLFGAVPAGVGVKMAVSEGAVNAAVAQDRIEQDQEARQIAGEEIDALDSLVAGELGEIPAEPGATARVLTELGIEDDLMKPQPASEDDLKKIGKGIKSPELVAARKAAAEKHAGIKHEVIDRWAAGEAGYTEEAVPKILNRDVFDDTDQMTKKEMGELSEKLRAAALEAETGKPEAPSVDDLMENIFRKPTPDDIDPEKYEENQRQLKEEREAKTPKRTKVKVSPEMDERFEALADAQRGKPENAMLDLTKHSQGGVLSVIAEHAGDLTHRMAQKPSFFQGGFEWVKEKVDRVHRSLTFPYGFEREFEENVKNNGTDRTELDRLGKVYADEHRKLTVYNEAQRTARDLAVAIGEQRWDDARALVSKLKEHTDKGQNHWIEYSMKDEAQAPTEPNQADKEAALILAQKNLNLFRQNLETEAAEEGVKMADLAVDKLDELRRLEGEHEQARKAAESTRKPKEKRETTEEEREFRGKEIDDAFAEGTLIPPGEEDSRSFEEKKQEDLFGGKAEQKPESGLAAAARKKKERESKPEVTPEPEGQATELDGAEYKKMLGSYSGDKIPNGRVRKPFKHDGDLWIAGGGGVADGGPREAYKLVPKSEYEGETTTYGEADFDARRESGRGFYDGMVVKRGKNDWVLVGPPRTFVKKGQKPAPETKIEDETTAPETPPEPKKTKFSILSSTAQLKVSGLKEQLYEATTEEEVDELHETYKGQLGVDRGKKKVPWKGYVPYNSDKLWDLAKKRIRNTGSPRPKPQKKALSELQRGVEAGDAKALIRNHVLESGGIYANPKYWGEEIWGGGDSKYGKINEVAFLRKGPQHRSKSGPDELFEWAIEAGYVSRDQFQDVTEFVQWALGGSYKIQEATAPAASRVEPKTKAEKAAADRGVRVKSIRNAVPERMGALDSALEEHNIRPDSAGSSTLTEREAAAIEYAADLALVESGIDAHQRSVEFIKNNSEMLSKLPKDELKVFEDLFKATAERIDNETGEDAHAYGEPEDKDKVPFDPKGGPRPITEDELPVLTVRPPADHFAANAPNTTARPLMLELDKSKVGKRPVGRREVNERISEALLALGIATPVSVGRMGALSRTARGFFRVYEEVIRILQAEDFTTIMHEFGHAVQKHVLGYPKGGPFTKANGFDKPIRDELMELGKNLYGRRKPSVGGYKTEGFAEGWKLYLINPELLKKSYPLTYEWIDNYVSQNKKAKKLFEKAQEGARTYIHQGAALRAKMDMVDLQSFRERAKKTKLFLKHNSPTSRWIESGRVLIDLEQAAESILGRKLTRAESPMFSLASRRLKHSAITRNWVETGQTDWGGNHVGPSLAEAMSLVRDAPVETLRSFMNQFSSTRSEDFGSYLWAMRTIALSETGRNSGMVLDDARFLKVYFEDKYPQFEKAGSMVWTWNDNVLLYAAEASPTFAQVVARVMEGDPGNYVPLKRVFDEYNHKYRKFREESPSGTGKSLVQHLRGSNRSVKQIFPQMISQAENTIRAAHQERVIHTMFEIAKIEGMGEFLERVPEAREVKLKIGMGDVFDRIRDELANLGVQMDELDEAISEGDREAMSKVLMTFWGNANRAQKGAEPVVARVNDAGVVEFWQVNVPGIYEALEGMDAYHFGDAGQAGGEIIQNIIKYGAEIPASTLRAGTTGLRASFGLVTNPARDLQTLLVNTQSTAMAPAVLWAYTTSMIESFLFTMSRGGPKAEEIFGGSFRSDAVDLFVRLGGQMTQPLSQDTDQARQAAKRLLEAKGFRVLDYKNWINFYQDIVQTPEMAPRIAEIKLLAKQHGIDIKTPSASDALFLLQSAAEVTTDFTASGTTGRMLNRIMPFFNANIQGPRANLRAAKRNVKEMQAALKGEDTILGKSREASRIAALRALTFFIRGAQMSAISMALWYNNKDKDFWKELKLRDKYIDWHIDLSEFFDEPTVLRIPRAFEVGLVFAAFPEALLDQWYHDDPEAVKAWFLFSLDYMNPFNATVLIGEGIAQLRGAGGYDGFFDTPIDSLGDVLSKKKEARDRYGPYTTGLAIWLGDKLNWSPKRIDHLIRNTLGPVGSDIAALTTGRGPGFIESDEKANHAIYGRLFTRGGDIAPNPRSVTKLYNLFEEYDKTPDDETDEHKVARLLLRDAARLTTMLAQVYALSESSTPEGRKHRRAIRLERIRVAKDAMAAVESDDVWEMMRERRWVKGDKKDWDWEYESRQEEVKERGHLR